MLEMSKNDTEIDAKPTPEEAKELIAEDARQREEHALAALENLKKEYNVQIVPVVQIIGGSLKSTLAISALPY